MDFFKKFFGEKETSGRVAKDRLRIVLMHDRTDITPQLLEDLRDEIIQVLTKYMEIDEQKIDIALDKDDQRAVALVANIPVIKIKRGKVAIN